MKKRNKNTVKAFYALLRAGLWEQGIRLMPYSPLDFDALYQLAEEQSVVGLIAAGLEHVEDTKPTKQQVLPFMKKVFSIECRNSAMNDFIGMLVDNMRDAGIYALLIKGQGVAQCYKRPLWRSCGDIDFFLSEDDYRKAKDYLIPLATNVNKEYVREKHLGMTIEPWIVELHGSLYSGLSSRLERCLDEVYKDTFLGGSIRSWQNDKVQVFMLSVENDAFYIFTHILQHFYKGGIGLRQLCDWCRLLWTYHDSINVKKLEAMLQKARLLTTWKAFGAFAVDYLGMPSMTMPLYSVDRKWKRKATIISSFVIEVGNFGHNRDQSYFKKYPYLIRKTISLFRRIGDLICHARIFPHDSLRFFPVMIYNGIRSTVRGE